MKILTIAGEIYVALMMVTTVSMGRAKYARRVHPLGTVHSLLLYSPIGLDLKDFLK